MPAAEATTIVLVPLSVAVVAIAAFATTLSSLIPAASAAISAALGGVPVFATGTMAVRLVDAAVPRVCSAILLGLLPGDDLELAAFRLPIVEPLSSHQILFDDERGSNHLIVTRGTQDRDHVTPAGRSQRAWDEPHHQPSFFINWQTTSGASSICRTKSTTALSTVAPRPTMPH